MKQLILRTILSISLMLAVAVPVTATVHADTPKADVCNSIGEGTTCSSSTDGLNINSVITLVVNILSVIVGAAAVVMIIVASYRFITSSGDSSKISAAKNTIIYAMIGLVILVLAQFIVHFVISKATNATSTGAKK